jgi:hypothetical protein
LPLFAWSLVWLFVRGTRSENRPNDDLKAIRLCLAEGGIDIAEDFNLGGRGNCPSFRQHKSSGRDR